MRIVLATPLYPPDTAPQARYAKELAARLSREHEVTVVAYSHIPEEVPGVTCISVDKRKPIPLRLSAFTFALARAMKQADVVLAINGPSVELPLTLLLFLKKPIVFAVIDPTAEMRSRSNPLLHLAHQRIHTHMQALITALPMVRPEVLPFEEPSVLERTKYEESWQEHMATLRKIFTYGS